MSNPDFNRILDGLPKKPPRSRLEPYRELVLEMRRRGRTFREIALVLGEKCGVSVVASTVYDFVNATQTREENSALRAAENTPVEHTGHQQNRNREDSNGDIDRRIAELKARRAPAQERPKRFQFVSGEPLRLPKAQPSKG